MPKEIGCIKNITEINKHIQSDYKFIDNKSYSLVPHKQIFKEPILWEITLDDLPENYIDDKNDLTVYYYNVIRNKWETVETSYNEVNNSSDTYIFMAFSESPFTNSSGIPNNAR